MINLTMQNYLVNGYNAVAFTHNYIFGWADNKTGMVYGYRVMNAEALLAWISCLDKASSKNGGTIQLKFRPNVQQKAIIMSNAVEIKPICSIDYFEQTRTKACRTEKNRGYLFERLACEAFGLVQNQRSNVKSSKAGDAIDANGVQYQIKFEKAVFIDEKTLHNFLAERI